MTVSSEEQTARELVAKSCRILGGLNLTKAATGHVSQRSPDGKHIFVRARGRDEIGVRYTTAEQIVKVDLDGNKIDGADGLAVPQEIFIHTWLYRTRPEIRSVVHVHPVTVMLFTICDIPLEPLYGGYDPPSLELCLDGVPTYGRSVTISNDELGKDFIAAMGSHNACLMRGHGVTTAGATVEEATVTAIRLNELAEINYRARLLGNPKSISAEDIAEFKRRRAQQAGKPSPYLQSTWRYYTDLAGA